ncbi:MAG: hypothetical protein QOE14_1969 [Humisphaera sp.]|nr:hypothetical protein [Humisphaera sp.]
METRILTPQTSRDIVEVLIKQHGWTISRIAKATDTSADFVRRVRAAKQNFEQRDVETLAKASGQKVYRLLVDSMQFNKRMPKQLNAMAQRVVAQHEEFSRIMTRKTPARKRRNGNGIKAA